MKRFTEQLQKKANSIRLSAAETRDLRERLVSYMEYHPLPADMLNKPANSSQVDSTFIPGIKILKLNGWRVLQWAGATMGVLLLTFSMSAEKAVPGDSLYAMKVRFNEELRSTLARTPYEKVVWETERLNRRVAEARLLASEGRLTNEVEVEVANAVKLHSDNARREIEELKQTDREGAAIASLQLDSALAVQSTSFRNKEQESVGKGKSTSLIANAINNSKKDEIENSQEELPSFARLMAYSERETTRAYELLKSIERLATLEEQTDIKRRLEDIGRVIAEAVVQSEKDNVAAREQLVSVVQRVQKLIFFMTNIDVRETMSVEDIVPVTFTLEERIEKVKKTVEDTEFLLNLLDKAFSASSTSELGAKLLPAIAESKLATNEVVDNLKLSEFDIVALEQKITVAYSLALDSANLLNIDINALPEETIIDELQLPSTATSTSSTTDPAPKATSSAKTLSV